MDYSILQPGSQVKIGKRQTTFVEGEVSIPLNEDIEIEDAGKAYKAKALSCKTYVFAYLQNIHFAHSCLPEVNNWPSAWRYFTNYVDGFTQLSKLTLIDFVAESEVKPVWTVISETFTPEKPESGE